jgi:hypothetical protein
MANEAEITDPATEVWEACEAINRPAGDVTTEAALKQFLGVTQKNAAVFFNLLARLNERFDVLEACVKHAYSSDPALLSRNLSIIEQIRAFLRLKAMHTKWEQVRGSCFDPKTLDVMRNIGFGLRPHFPLRKLSAERRNTLIENLKKEIEKFGNGPITASIDKALVSSLESLVSC